jgi:hypothetical protein
MTPSRIRAGVVSERVAWLGEMIRSDRAPPVETYDEFYAPENVPCRQTNIQRNLVELFFSAGLRTL